MKYLFTPLDILPYTSVFIFSESETSHLDTLSYYCVFTVSSHIIRIHSIYYLYVFFHCENDFFGILWLSSRKQVGICRNGPWTISSQLTKHSVLFCSVEMVWKCTTPNSTTILYTILGVTVVTTGTLTHVEKDKKYLLLK